MCGSACDVSKHGETDRSSSDFTPKDFRSNDSNETARCMITFWKSVAPNLRDRAKVTMRRLVLFAATVGLLVNGSAAQTETDSSGTSVERRTVEDQTVERRTVEAYAQALQTQNLGALIRLWHDGGELSRPFATVGAPERHTGADAVRRWYAAHFDRVDRIRVPAGIRATRDPHRFIVRSVVTSSTPSSEASNQADEPATFVHLVVVYGDAIWTVTRVPDPAVLRGAFE